MNDEYERVDLFINNLQREIWEGWTVQDFIDDLSDTIEMIMSNKSYVKPFKTKADMVKFIQENQPYYKNQFGKLMIISLRNMV